ncbi:porin [Uruburuella testudinis]|uniref:Porin n=1 Tax=Uruburuella testudinis TaxID=1282863 RepID=A0ABY4DUX5_9NEIS|nr:porin [Uruburuella testudinis]UOO82258.1 porin [Uruburuella testudinis]
MKQYLVLAFTALPALAAAEVKMYGQIKSGIAAGQVKISGSNGSEKSAVATEIVDNTSRFGFKGSEKISDDLKAVWQVEQRISVINAREGWATRDSFVGLEGKFGKLRAGNISNQLNWMDNIDPWMYSNNALGLGVFTRTGNRKASIRYDTPKIAGFDANIQVSPRDNQNPADRRTHRQPEQTQYDAGLNYSNAGYFVQLGYNMRKNRYQNSNGAYKDSHVGRLLAGYDANNLFIGVGAQHAKGYETGNSYIGYFTNGFNSYNGASIREDKSEAVKVTDAAVTATYRFGNIKPQITYAHGWAAKGVNSGDLLVDKFDQIILGGDYRFSKRTSARLSMAHVRVGSKTRLNNGNTGKIQQTAAQLGLHHRF